MVAKVGHPEAGVIGGSFRGILGAGSEEALVKLSTSKVVLCMECPTLPLAGPQLPLGVMVDLVLVIQQYSVGGGLGFGEDIGDVPIETFGKDGAFL